VHHLGQGLCSSFPVLAGSDSIQNNVVRLPGAFVHSLEMLGYSEEGFFRNMLDRIWLDLLVMAHYVGEAESLLNPGECSGAVSRFFILEYRLRSPEV
jgi:hypothetical protein